MRFKEFTDEWSKHRLGNVMTFKNGLNKGKDFFGTGTPIVNYMDVNKNENIFSSMIKGVVTVTNNEIENFKIIKGDVFFTRTSETSDEIGLSASLLDDIPRGVFSGFVLRGRPISGIFEPSFSGYYFRSKGIRKEIIKHSSITTRALTSGSSLSQINISIPSLMEQNKIARLLELIDKKIVSQRKLINLYKSLIKMIKTLKFDKQIDFKYQSLIDVCDITTGKLNANAMAKNGKYDFFTCSKESYKTDTYAFDCEALLIAGNGEVGLTKYFKGKFNAYQRTYVLKNFKLNAKYLKLYLDFTLVDYLRSKTNSSAMSYITLETLSSLPIRLIDEKRQESFVANIEKIEKLYYKLEQELSNLEILKGQLLRKIFI